MMSKIAQAASMSALPGKMTVWFPKFKEAAKKQKKYSDFKYKSSQRKNYEVPVIKNEF